MKWKVKVLEERKTKKGPSSSLYTCTPVLLSILNRRVYLPYRERTYMGRERHGRESRQLTSFIPHPSPLSCVYIVNNTRVDQTSLQQYAPPSISRFVGSLKPETFSSLTLVRSSPSREVKMEEEKWAIKSSLRYDKKSKKKGTRRRSSGELLPVKNNKREPAAAPAN